MHIRIYRQYKCFDMYIIHCMIFFLLSIKQDRFYLEANGTISPELAYFDGTTRVKNIKSSENLHNFVETSKSDDLFIAIIYLSPQKIKNKWPTCLFLIQRGEGKKKEEGIEQVGRNKSSIRSISLCIISKLDIYWKCCKKSKSSKIRINRPNQFYFKKRFILSDLHSITIQLDEIFFILSIIYKIAQKLKIIKILFFFKL